MLVRACLLTLVLLVPSAAAAHPAYAALFSLDRHEDEVRAELALPLDPLRLALDADVRGGPEALLTEERPALVRYLLAHVALLAADGRLYTPVVRSLTATRSDDVAQLVAELVFEKPAGASTRSFTLRSDIILHRLPSHQLFVTMRRDFTTGTLGDAPEPLGVITAQQTSLAITRKHASRWRGFVAVFWLGVQHVAEGTDHLLFLLMLLVPAPLVASAQRWRGRRTLVRTWGKTGAVVTAFTLGHSLTLVLAALGVLGVPERPVELLIALSIFVSALHVLRPLFAEREPLVAGLFGLMHGLAFASALQPLLFDSETTLLVLFGFNLGIEAVQLALLLVTMPWLIVLSRAPVYDGVRWLSASFALLAAGSWTIERAFDIYSPIASLVERVAGHWYLWLGALVLAAVVTRLRSSRVTTKA